jgi:hypothetical protein
MDTFSRRFGYSAAQSDNEIATREDATEHFRHAVVRLAKKLGTTPSRIRETVCDVLLRAPNPQNWGGENVWEEVVDLVEHCPWPKVYEIAEAIYNLYSQGGYRDHALNYQTELNDFMVEAGVGWKLVDGRFEFRGPAEFENSIAQAEELAVAQGYPDAASEFREAVADLSRRPKPDITGAIQHSLTGLECVVRSIVGNQKATLGELLKKEKETLNLPAPIETILEKAWGHASEVGRHVREGRMPTLEEAELLVAISSAAARFLLARQESN